MIDRRRALLTRKSGGRLPSEYQEVEWIESDRNAYINTQVYVNSTDGFECEVSLSGNDARGMGAYNFSGLHGFYFDYIDGGIRICTTGWKIAPRQPIVLININAYYKFACINSEWKLNDELVYTSTPVDEPHDLYIFKANNGGSVTGTGVVGYKYFKYYKDNALVREYIPVYRKSDGVIGMYDLCGSICPLTGTPFYINAGTGTFTKGPDVN